MAPSPSSDLLLLKEHEYYNTGNLQSVLPFLQNNDDYSSSSGSNIILGIIAFVIVGLLINKRTSWVLNAVDTCYGQIWKGLR